MEDRITEGRTERVFVGWDPAADPLEAAVVWRRSGLNEGWELLPRPRGGWLRRAARNALKHLLCSHRCTERDWLRQTWRCRCGWFEVTDLLVRLKPGYWQEYV